MRRSLLRVVLVVAAVLCAAPLRADDPVDGAQFPTPAPEKDKQKQEKAQHPAKDPAAEAFLLPKGVVLTPKQREAYEQIRQQFTPLLESALDRVQSGTDEADKLKAVAEVKQLKEQIRQAILEILQNPSLAKSQDAAKKKQANHAKKAKKKGSNKARVARKKGGKNHRAKKTDVKKTGAKKTDVKKTGAKKTGAKKTGAKKTGVKKKANHAAAREAGPGNWPA